MSYQNDIRNWVIYKITSPSGRVYIGKSCDFKARIRNYRCHKAKTQPALKHSFDKYGFDSHEIKILETFNSNCDYAGGKEIFWIKSQMSNYAKYPKQRGMNVTDGGEGILGAKRSDEERQRMRERNLGKKESEETRLKKRLSMLGKNKVYGRKRSPESIEKGASQLRGRKYTEEHKLKYKDSQAYKRKPIIQMDLDGRFIDRHESVHSASIKLGVKSSNIFSHLSGRCSRVSQFKFKYE